MVEGEQLGRNGLDGGRRQKRKGVVPRGDDGPERHEKEQEQQKDDRDTPDAECGHDPAEEDAGGPFHGLSPPSSSRPVGRNRRTTFLAKSLVRPTDVAVSRQ